MPVIGRSYDEMHTLFPCEVRMEDRTWQPGEVLATQDTERGVAAFVRWEGITAWLFRAQGRGRPDEWRRADA